MIVGGIQFRIDKCTHAQIHQLLLVVLCACVRAIVITTKYFGPLNAIIQFIALHWSLLHFIFNRDESFEIASIRYWDTHTHTLYIYVYAFYKYPIKATTMGALLPTNQPVGAWECDSFSRPINNKANVLLFSNFMWNEMSSCKRLKVLYWCTN